MNTKIKVILPMLLFIVVGCSGGSGGDSGESEITEMQVGVTESAFIDEAGDVDTYHLRAAETNRFLSINCNEKASGSGVEVLVTVFEEDASGNRVRLFGKHKPQDATPPANLDMAVYIDQPKDLYITVRDLMDDDASTEIAYHLTCEFMDAGEDNHDFSNAQHLAIGSSNIYLDAIEEVGEVDCFTFSPQTAGVYNVTVAHMSENYLFTNVQLAMSLYDGEGNRIQGVTAPNRTILSCLDPEDGPYYVTVHDSDDMHKDSAATYAMTVAEAAAGEMLANDAWDTSFILETDGSGMFIAEGAIEYASASGTEDYGPDADWYEFDMPESWASSQAVQFTISVSEEVNTASILRVEVCDETLSPITSHDFYCSGGAYENRFQAGSGIHYISVTPLNPGKLAGSAGYVVQLQPGDLDDDDNNTETDATELQSGVQVEGDIGYHSDVDWYSIRVDTATAGILGVELTADASIIDYQLSIWRGVQLIKKVSDLSGMVDETHLKTAVYIPNDYQGTAVYHIKVCDAQNDEGSEVAYRLTATESGIPVDVPDIAQVGAGDVLRYYSESDEQTENGGAYTDVELEIFSGYQPTYLANTDWLDFRASILPGGVGVSYFSDSTATITFPWIAGYIDYQGDRDIFEIDFDKLSVYGEETEWYYDVQIRLLVPQPGSHVEYVWKLYRDRNRNGVIMDDPTSPDGYKACAGDDTPDVQEGLDQTVPGGNDTFWIGSEWGEDAKFYIGISDFNYEHLPDSGEPLMENPDPDDDWGYDVPYYFQLELTYHPGEARPG
jgi:hypothetical protein